MDHNRPARTTTLRRDLVLCFAAVLFGIVAALSFLYVGAGQHIREVQLLLAVFIVALASLIYTVVFVRNA